MGEEHEAGGSASARAVAGGVEPGAPHSGHRDGGHFAGHDASGNRDASAPDVVRDEAGHVPGWHIYPRDAGPDGSQSRDAAVPDVPPVKEPDIPIPPGPGPPDTRDPYGQQSADDSATRSDANYSGGDGNAYYTDGSHIPVSTTEGSVASRTDSSLPGTDFGAPHSADSGAPSSSALPGTDFGDPYSGHLPGSDFGGPDSGDLPGTDFGGGYLGPDHSDSGASPSFDGGHSDVGHFEAGPPPGL
jgi:hypothetical protein